MFCVYYSKTWGVQCENRGLAECVVNNSIRSHSHSHCLGSLFLPTEVVILMVLFACLSMSLLDFWKKTFEQIFDELFWRVGYGLRTELLDLLYVGSILLYFGFFVLIWLILLLIFVVYTSASDCLEDRLRNDLLLSRMLNLTHSLTY